MKAKPISYLQAEADLLRYRLEQQRQGVQDENVAHCAAAALADDLFNSKVDSKRYWNTDELHCIDFWRKPSDQELIILLRNAKVFSEVTGFQVELHWPGKEEVGR